MVNGFFRPGPSAKAFLAMSLEPRALKHEPCAFSHEPLTILLQARTSTRNGCVGTHPDSDSSQRGKKPNAEEESTTKATENFKSQGQPTELSNGREEPKAAEKRAKTALATGRAQRRQPRLLAHSEQGLRKEAPDQASHNPTNTHQIYVVHVLV